MEYLDRHLLSPRPSTSNQRNSTNSPSSTNSLSSTNHLSSINNPSNPSSINLLLSNTNLLLNSFSHPRLTHHLQFPVLTNPQRLLKALLQALLQALPQATQATLLLPMLHLLRRTNHQLRRQLIPLQRPHLLLQQHLDGQCLHCHLVQTVSRPHLNPRRL